MRHMCGLICSAPRSDTSFRRVRKLFCYNKVIFTVIKSLFRGRRGIIFLATPCPQGAYMKNIALIGSTGSIGRQTIEVALENPDKFKIVAMAADSSYALFEKQLALIKPEYAALADAFDTNIKTPQKQSSAEEKAPRLQRRLMKKRMLSSLRRAALPGSSIPRRL